MGYSVLDMARAFETASGRAVPFQIGDRRSAISQCAMLTPPYRRAEKGDLAGVSVYQFKINKQEILLLYSVETDELLLISLGSHENFYRDMSR